MRGFILEAAGGFHWKTYSTVDLRTGKALGVDVNGKPIRRQQSILLTRATDGLTKSSPTITRLQADRQEHVEKWEKDAAAGIVVDSPAADMTVTEFYEQKFLPWLESLVATGQKSHATLVSYRQYWDSYLADHFNGTKTFKNYQPYVGQQFLDSLRKDDGTPLGSNTVRHIHSTASGIFARAIRSMKDITNDKDVAALNPWHLIKVSDAPAISAEQGPAATEKEVETIIANLETERGGRNDWSVQLAQTALAVGIYAGLRPSEIAGLQWQSVNLDEVSMTICRAHVYGKTKEKTKTKRNRVVHYDDKLTGILRTWWAVKGSPKSGWVFPNRDGNPVNMSNLIDRIIRPSCSKNGVEWNDFYALRRGTISDRVNIRKWSLEEVAEFAGNTAAVIEKHYLIKDGTLNFDARERDRENDRRKADLLELGSTGRRFRALPAETEVGQ
jgi:integrase